MTFETEQIGDCTLYRGDCLDALYSVLMRNDNALRDLPS